MNINTLDKTKTFDIDKIRADFPILHQNVNGKPWVYFDNGASAQKPLKVINSISDYYSHFHSNVHRGVHYMSQIATDKFEAARNTVQKFLNAKHSHEIIWTTGTTEGINLVSSCYGKGFVGEGDEIIISTLEHHSNIVPWQMLCEEKKAILKVIPIDDNGVLDMEAFEKMVTEKTKIVSIVYISNALGVRNPIEEIIRIAHEKNVPVLLDAAQAAPHTKIDVQALDVDFCVFSGHKLFGPTGIGILYGKEKWLDAMPPYRGGGEMIATVTFEKTTYAPLPFKFEAGTPNIADAIGLGAAIDYIEEVGYEGITAHESELLRYGTEKLSAIEGLKIFGNTENKASVISFLLGDSHPYDVGTILDKMGIAVRTGHHCTQPLMQRLNIPGTVRASMTFYNTKEEIDRLAEGLMKVKKMFGI
jgi:cysteine desulfurase/selenocysteine lyase